MSSAFTESLLSTDADSFLWMPELPENAGARSDHVPFYFWLIAVCRPRLLVALGPFHRLAYAAFCEAAARTKLDSRFCAVDTSPGNRDASSRKDADRKFREFNQRHYASFSQILSLDEDRARKLFDDGSIDLLYLRDHGSCEALRRQFDIWRPKLSERVVVIFEGMSMQGEESGARQFFAKLKPEFPTFEFTHDRGLRLFVSGADAPHAVQQLCALTRSDDSTAIRRRFSTLGAQWTKNAETASRAQLLSTQLAQANIIIAHISARHSALNSRSKATLLWFGQRGLKASLRHSVAPAVLDAIRNSVFFDPDFYLEANPHVRAGGIDPALHYLLHGGAEGRDPGPAFSTTEYLNNNPDVRASGMNALSHYELHGRAEGRAAPCSDPALAMRAADATSSKKPGMSWLKKIRMNLSLRRRGSHAGRQNDTSYANWIRLYDTISENDLRLIKIHIEKLDYQPLISVVMPAYDTPEDLLREAIASIQAQLYRNWELCIADDASPSPTVMNVLQEMASRDTRIKWMRRESNGHISEASNSAMDLATGEFIALMDHDDLLPEHALYEVVAELNEHPDADVIYSDEDRIDDAGHRHSPYFKTDWNPELFLGHNLVSHLGVYRRSIVEKVGRFRKGYEGSQDYDLALRVVNVTTPAKIRHIPSVLYHWRGGIATFSEARLPRCIAAARAAKADFFVARGEAAEVLENSLVPAWERIRRPVPSPPLLVSLIVPTRNRHDLLAPCLDGLLNRTDYQPIEVLIVDHESDDPDTRELLERWRADERVRIIRYEGAFNYSDMNNKAVAHARGEIIGLINNDVDVIEPDWLSEMVSYAMRPENGAVGAKLLYPNDHVQHAGVVLGCGGIAGHLHLNAARQAIGYFGRLALPSNVSAVTGACLILRKSVFEEVGGLNATDLPVAFNDVDLCLKIQAKGYRNVWTPFALLYHHESPSRGLDTTPEKIERARRETGYMRRQWGHLIDRDPYFNPNLSLQTSSFDLAFPPRRVKPWTLPQHPAVPEPACSASNSRMEPI